MKFLQDINGVDLYLLDQLSKARINPNNRILDAGCGKGRNMRLFLENNYNILGIDPNKEAINKLIQKHPDKENCFSRTSIEDFKDHKGFDFIICNAVLHFAKDHTHFEQMFKSLFDLLNDGGILFIRMTSDIGLDIDIPTNGVTELPDGTTRYLLTKTMLDQLIKEYKLSFLDPLKTVNVDDQRCMSTVVLKK